MWWLRVLGVVATGGQAAFLLDLLYQPRLLHMLLFGGPVEQTLARCIMPTLTVCCKMWLQGLVPARQHLMQLDHADWHAVMCAVSAAPCSHAYICIPVSGILCTGVSMPITLHAAACSFTDCC